MKVNRYIPLSRWDIVRLLAIFLLAASLIAVSRFSRLSNSKSISSEKPVDIYLDQPVNLEKLGSMLSDSGLVSSKEELIWAGRLLGWRTFQRGYYQVDGNYSYDVLLSRMARGIQDPVSIPLIPGSTEEHLANRIAVKMHFDTAAFKEVINDSSLLRSLGVDRKDLLGRMFPDTYSMYWTNKPESVLKKILNEFDKVVYKKHENRFKELNLSVDEIITLASIIEWEANVPEEKKKISGLYWNRLNRGMRLQADPTINYVLNERRRLVYEDYQIDHPYNTYLNRGLPPGPITNPDLTSIEAALFPADHDYLYMVASPEGYHVFSETFEQHKKESAKWRKWIREQYRKKREKEGTEENS